MPSLAFHLDHGDPSHCRPANPAILHPAPLLEAATQRHHGHSSIPPYPVFAEASTLEENGGRMGKWVNESRLGRARGRGMRGNAGVLPTLSWTSSRTGRGCARIGHGVGDGLLSKSGLGMFPRLLARRAIWGRPLEVRGGRKGRVWRDASLMSGAMYYAAGCKKEGLRGTA
jgi:hypothetical protein